MANALGRSARKIFNDDIHRAIIITAIYLDGNIETVSEVNRHLSNQDRDLMEDLHDKIYEIALEEL